MSDLPVDTPEQHEAAWTAPPEFIQSGAVPGQVVHVTVTDRLGPAGVVWVRADTGPGRRAGIALSTGRDPSVLFQREYGRLMLNVGPDDDAFEVLNDLPPVDGLMLGTVAVARDAADVASLVGQSSL